MTSQEDKAMRKHDAAGDVTGCRDVGDVGDDVRKRAAARGQL